MAAGSARLQSAAAMGRPMPWMAVRPNREGGACAPRRASVDDSRGTPFRRQQEDDGWVWPLELGPSCGTAFWSWTAYKYRGLVVTRVGEEIRRGATQPEPRDVAAERNSNVERGTFRQKSEEGISKDATRVRRRCTLDPSHPRERKSAARESRPQTTPDCKKFLG